MWQASRRFKQVPHSYLSEAKVWSRADSRRYIEQSGLTEKERRQTIRDRSQPACSTHELRYRHDGDEVTTVTETEEKGRGAKGRK